MTARRALKIGFILLLLLFAYLLARHYFDLHELAARERSLRAIVQHNWWWAILAGLLLYTVASLIPGTVGKSMVVAWLYGFTAGLLIVNVALTIAAVLTFLLSRYALHELVQERFGSTQARVNRGLDRAGARFVLLLRLLHAPYTIVNYTLGTTGLRTRTFWWTTQLGLLPGNVVFVYAGSRLPSLTELAKHGPQSIFTGDLLLALVLLSLFPIILYAFSRLLFKKATVEAIKGMKR